MSPAAGGASSGPGSLAWPVGLQLWSVREELEAHVPQTLAQVRALGFEMVELAGTCGLTAHAFRGLLDEVGLRATSMHVPFARLVADEEGVWDDAAALGVGYVGVPNLPAVKGRLSPHVVQGGADALNAWGASACTHGLRFFLHTHGAELRTEPGAEPPIEALMRRTVSGLVTFQLDVLWATVAGASPVDLLMSHPGRWGLLHLRDVALGPTPAHAERHEEKPLGEGEVSVPALLATAAVAGVEVYVIEDEAPDPLGRIGRSLDYLQRVGRGHASATAKRDFWR